MKTAGATIAAIVIVIALCVGAYLGYWWLSKDTVNREAAITNNGYNRQTSLVEDISRKIVDAEGNIPKAQRKAIVSLICEEADQLTGSVSLSFSAQTFITTECY